MGRASEINEHGAEQNHWTERGRAASVSNSEATGRPRRSVLALGAKGAFRYFCRQINAGMKDTIINGLALVVLVCGCCSHYHPASWPPGAPAVFNTTSLKDFRRDQQDQFSSQERRLIATARRAIREAHKLPAKGYTNTPDYTTDGLLPGPAHSRGL